MDQLARDKQIDPATIEVWFADEARIGQKNKITRRWARRGSRPSAPHDQRTASTYIFGAICPKNGKGAALVLPRCNIAAMNLHLAEIAMAVAPGAHAVLVLDQAGWHLSDKLIVPPNITLVPLPPKCPEAVKHGSTGSRIGARAAGRDAPANLRQRDSCSVPDLPTAQGPEFVGDFKAALRRLAP